MGQNSTEVAYGFGQFGSAYTGAASQVRPPKGMVIIAIQFINANTPTELTSVVPDNDIGTIEYFDQAVASHQRGDTIATCVTSGASTTLTLSAANSLVKVGQIIESQGNTNIPYSLTAPTKVVAYDGNLTVTMSAAHTVSSQTCGFYSEGGSGFGGTATGTGGNVVFPAGITIYGRWTSITPSVDATGGIICYFGY